MADIETPPPPKAPSIHVNHYCEHPDCKRWGSFGYDRGKGKMEWFCGEHRTEGPSSH